MNDRQRIRLAQTAADRLAAISRLLGTVAPDGTTVMGRMRDAQGPLRGRSYEPRSHAPASSSVSPLPVFGDAALADERDLDASLEAAAKAINRVTNIVANWPPAHAASALERRALGLGDGPWCASCAQAPGADGSPRRERVEGRFAGPSDCDGVLPEPLWLCQWCRRATCDWGRLPTAVEAQRHAQGLRVSWPSDVPRPKETTA